MQESTCLVLRRQQCVKCKLRYFPPRQCLTWIYTCILLIDKVALHGERCLSGRHLKNSFKLFWSYVAIVERFLKTLKDFHERSDIFSRERISFEMLIKASFLSKKIKDYRLHVSIYAKTPKMKWMNKVKFLSWIYTHLYINGLHMNLYINSYI